MPREEMFTMLGFGDNKYITVYSNGQLNYRGRKGKWKITKANDVMFKIGRHGLWEHSGWSKEFMNKYDDYCSNVVEQVIFKE